MLTITINNKKNDKDIFIKGNLVQHNTRDSIVLITKTPIHGSITFEDVMLKALSPEDTCTNYTGFSKSSYEYFQGTIALTQS